MTTEHSSKPSGEILPDDSKGSINDDILHGADQIGAHLNVSPRRCFHLLENGFIPAFKLGARWAARRSRLDRYMAEMEDAS